MSDKDTKDAQDGAATPQRDAVNTQSATPQSDAGGTPASFDTWLGAQPDDVRARIEENISGLKSALTAEREANREREKELRDLAAKAEKGSLAQKELERLADQLAESDRRADFYEAAQHAGVTNLKLAYIAATQDELFDHKGNPQFDALRERYPELFVIQTAPSGHAGAGTQKPLTQKPTMTDFIRRAAGRQ